MFEERYTYAPVRKKKKVDKSFSPKINFYKKPDELPETIEAKDLKNFLKKKPRLSGHNKKIYNEIKYDSGWEAEYAKKLDLKVTAGLIKGWQRQVVIEINVIEVEGEPVLTDNTMLQLKENGIPFTHICNYKIDFVVTNNDDSKEYIEVKGVQTEVFKIKFRLFNAMFKIIHPGIKIILER
jgi:hypothetical protein